MDSWVDLALKEIILMVRMVLAEEKVKYVRHWFKEVGFEKEKAGS